MRRYFVPLALVLGLACSAGITTAAAGSTAATPRAGHFAGSETFSPDPIPVQLTVTNGPKTVRNFTGSARVKAGCKNNFAGYEAPKGPMKVTKAGHFTQSLTTYPGPLVTVTVTGNFTSPTTVTGHITIVFKRVKGCNSSRAFTATRT
jgi:hypothetical protein